MVDAFSGRVKAAGFIGVINIARLPSGLLIADYEMNLCLIG